MDIVSLALKFLHKSNQFLNPRWANKWQQQINSIIDAFYMADLGNKNRDLDKVNAVLCLLV